MEHKLIGKWVEVVKGSKSLSISKGTQLYVADIKELGSDYSYSVRLVLSYNGRTMHLYVRHMNRLNDWEFNLNNGDPLKKIRVRAPYPG